MNSTYKILIIAISLNLTGLLHALSQGVDRYHGSPFIRNYDVSEYNGSAQIWAIGQNKQGIMYFGDGKGLLEYDGTNWRLYPVDNYSVIRSLDTDTNGIVYVGAHNEFGYFQPDSTGTLTYSSLIQHIPDSLLDFKNIWKTLITTNGVYFVSRNTIFRWHNNKMSSTNVELQSLFAYKINDKIYVKDNNLGICYIDNNELVPLKNCESLNSYKAGYFHILPYENNKLLISLNYLGFFIYDLKNEELATLPAPGLTQDYIRENLGFFPITINDKEMAYSTITGGIVFINKKGEITRVINKLRGLTTNSIYSIYLDKANNLWAATQNGISRIDLSYPAIQYSRQQGINDYILDIETYNNTQYISTTNKVYYLPPYVPSVHNDNHEAKVVENLTDCWDLFQVKNHLLAGHRLGLSQINNNKASLILFDNRVFKGLYSEKHYPDKIFLGQGDGIKIASFIEKDNKLEITNAQKINGVNNQVRTFTFDNSGNIWVATYNSGIFYIHFKNKNLSDYTVTRYTHESGLPKEIHECSVEFFNNRINIFTHKGIFTPVFPEQEHADSLISFVHDTYWGDVYTKDSTSAIIAKQIDTNKFFIYGNRAEIFMKTGDSISLQFGPFIRIDDAFSISTDDNTYIKMGTATAFILYNYNIIKDYTAPFDVLIRKVKTSNDSVLFNGNSPYNDTQVLSNIPVLSYENNSMKFEFSATFYEESEKNRYSYMIDGFDKKWSNWSHEPTATYTNIPFGEYTFKVRATNIYGTTSKISTYTFIISPPWYRTWWAYILFSLFAALLIRLFFIRYTKKLKQQNIKLESLVKTRTVELQAAVNTLENQKISLNERQEEILSQNNELSAQREELKQIILKLKDTQEQLIQAEKMASLGILTAGVAHEINNPLNFIHNGTAEIEAYLSENHPEIRKALNPLIEAIDTGVKRTSDIVQSLGKYSRSEDAPFSVINVHDIIESCLVMLQNQYKYHIAIEKNYNALKPDIFANEGQIHQVFLNTIINAIQSINKEGIIKITTTQTDSEVNITVEDNGCGISEENLKHIYDPFFTTKDPGKGTGLGLSITHKIIQRHEGRIICESVESKGTKFTIILPIKELNNEV